MWDKTLKCHVNLVFIEISYRFALETHAHNVSDQPNSVWETKRNGTKLVPEVFLIVRNQDIYEILIPNVLFSESLYKVGFSFFIHFFVDGTKGMILLTCTHVVWTGFDFLTAFSHYYMYPTPRNGTSLYLVEYIV